MEFLVFCTIDDSALSSTKRAELYASESTRAAELAHAGILQRIWRVPGRTANIGVWQAEDATRLHEALSSLPLFPWMTIDVKPLAQHPNDPAQFR